VEIADAIRSHSHAPTEDLRQLWRRLVFNLLITNVDDHRRTTASCMWSEGSGGLHRP
jgi:serine/threonine protein kinase HipA of HipAB toxin-antitoxin module